MEKDSRSPLPSNARSEEAPLSISLGYSTGGWGDAVEEIFRRADDAMYRNKYERRWEVAGALQQYLGDLKGAEQKPEGA